LPLPEEGEYYVADLIGLRAQLEDGTAVGEVIDVVTYPTIDCLLVRSDEGDREIPMIDPWLVELRTGEGVALVSQLSDLDLQKPPRGGRRNG
jgi:16S rRNA processing protein RimM